MSKAPVRIPKDLKKAARIFHESGFQCWLVGGAVRDGLLGRNSEDYDLATDAEPAQVVKLFSRTIPTGIKHGTVTILLGSHQFETTTFRKDGEYSDGRRPDSISYSRDILEDLARRDFTINAIAWNVNEEKLLDPHDGQGDLARGIIRAIGEPERRFEEDGLRSIRACRFAAQLGFAVEPATLEAISGTLENVPGLSVERIWEELKKILRSPAPSRSFRLFRETGLLDIILPELDNCVNVGQKGMHIYDVFDHSLAACDAAPAPNLAVRAAALLHDIAKPVVKGVGKEGEAIFHHHDSVGAEIAEKILKRFKASNAVRARVVRLVRHHMFHYTPEWSDAAVRRFMTRTGLDMLEDLMSLRLADASAIAPGLPAPIGHLRELTERINAVLESSAALSIKDLELSGKDLMDNLEMPAGPALGRLLGYLLECVLEDPQVNEKDQLLEISRRWLEKT